MSHFRFAAVRWPLVAIMVVGVIAGLLVLVVRAPREPLRIGLNAWPGYEFLYLAQQKGFYREAGVEVRLVEFNSLSDARRAYERGQIDGLGTTVVEVLQARSQPGRNLQVVDVVDYSDGADVVLVKPSLTGKESLRGARVGVELGSLGIYVLVRALEEQGLTLEDIMVIALDQLSMKEAFEKGELDAVVSYPPVSIAMMRDGKAVPVYTTAKIPGEVVDVIAMDEKTVREQPDAVSKLLHAFRRAMDFHASNPAEANRIMADREGITPEEFALALSDGIRLVPASEQALYLGPGGKLSVVVDRTDRILRAHGQLSGADRRAGAFTDRFVKPLPP